MRLLTATGLLFCFGSILIAAKDVSINQALSDDILAWALQDLTSTPMENTDDNNRKRSTSSFLNNLPRRDEAVRYDVPGVNTTLWIRRGDALDPGAMEGAIKATYGVSQKLVSKLGDQQLPGNLEPLTMVANNGGAVILTSRKDQHLTFGIVGSAMQGFFNYLILAQKSFECTFEIWEDFGGNWGHVGDGVIQAH